MRIAFCNFLPRTYSPPLSSVIRHRKLRSFLDLSQRHQITYPFLKKKRAQTLSQQRQRRDRGAIKRVFLCHRLATESRAIRRLEATALEGPLGSALLLSCEPLSLCDADLPPASVALNNSL